MSKYRGAKWFYEQLEKHGSYGRMAEVFGVTRRTIRNWRKYAEQGKEVAPTPRQEKPQKRDKADPVKKAIKTLEDNGFFVSVHKYKTNFSDCLDISRYEDGEVITFGVVSDTHLGSKYQQLTHLHDFYHYCKKQGIKTILHCGDLVDAERVFDGQRYEVHTLGATGQKDYAVQFYPRVEGITTYVISGNHDEKFWVKAGFDILDAISREREDIVYIGRYTGKVKMGKLKILLQHGEGGGAYAVSYKLQKYMEQLPSEDKPHIVLLGHYHTPCIIPMYRNMFGLQVSCFQSQTLYLKRKMRRPVIAGHILTVRIVDRNGIDIPEVIHKQINYYKPIENDIWEFRRDAMPDTVYINSP